MSESFTRTIIVRFAHCDPAGIVFFPHWLGLVNEMVEDWFATGLGHSFHRIHSACEMGVPTVKLEADFIRPARLGDALQQSLGVALLGSASCTLTHQVKLGGDIIARFRQTIVYVSLATMRPAPWPAALRAAMISFQGPNT